MKSEIQKLSGNKIAMVLKMISQSITHLLPDLIIADSALSDINQNNTKHF